VGSEESSSGATHSDYPVHVVRALPDVCGRTCTGRIGLIVYATSNAQLTRWLTEWHAPPPRVAMLPIETVTRRSVVDGPAPELEDEMKALYEARYRR
jgi:hypothetical protein